MKHLLFISVAIIFLPGCISTKRYASYVDRAFTPSDTVMTSNIGNIHIATEGLEKFTPISQVKKGDSYFIPALVYWGVKESFHCYLNPKVPMNIFNTTCGTFADSLHINERLHGQRLELTVNSLPSKFVYSDNLHIVYLLFMGFYFGRQAITPESSNLSVTYKVYNGTTVMRVGNVTIGNTDKPLVKNNKSTRKITRLYIDQYYRNMTRMAQQCMLKLANEL